MKTKSNKTRHIVTLTTGQYDHLYNIMCSQEEILDYLNESDDFDPQTFDNLFDNICAAKETYDYQDSQLLEDFEDLIDVHTVLEEVA